jgi:hypothetical protein
MSPLGQEKPEAEPVAPKPAEEAKPEESEEEPEKSKGLKHIPTCTGPVCKGEGILSPMTHDESKFAGTVMAVFDKQYREVLSKIEEMV